MTKQEIANCKADLADAQKVQQTLLLNLQDFLSSNTGRCSTVASNKAIMHVADQLTIAGFNCCHYERKLSSLERKLK